MYVPHLWREQRQLASKQHDDVLANTSRTSDRCIILPAFDSASIFVVLHAAMCFLRISCFSAL